MNKLKSFILLGFLCLNFTVLSTNAQACDDSTCVGVVPLYSPTMQNTNTTSNGFILSPTPITTYNYRTMACPEGYRGTDGTNGLITEEQMVVTYPNGTVTYGEWQDLEDNCEVTPPPPPPPPPPSEGWMDSGYNFNAKAYSYTCRVSCFKVTLDHSNSSYPYKPAMFFNEFQLRTGGTTLSPRMETITKVRYDYLASQGFIFYHVDSNQVGPSNWGQVQHRFLICKKPSTPVWVESGIVTKCL